MWEALKNLVTGNLVTTIRDEVIAQGLVELAKSFFSSIGKTAAKKGSDFLEDYMTIKFGLKTVDERLYGHAKRLMKPTDRTRLNKKLMVFADGVTRQLADERFNYFRICLPLTDTVKTALILTGYAQLSPEDWDRECIEMGFLFQSDGVTPQKILDMVAAKQQQLSTSFSNHPVRQRLKRYRDTARDRANNQSWT